MAKMECPDCQEIIPDNAPCPNCANTRWVFYVGMFVLVAATIGLVCLSGH